MSSTPDLPAFVSTIDDYLRLEQRHSPAEQMFATVLTDDFEIGFRGGHQWKGLNGLRLSPLGWWEFGDGAEVGGDVQAVSVPVLGWAIA